MVLRIFAFILLLLSILFMPFWVSAVLALAGMVYFSFFLEAPLLFLLSDVLYGVPEIKLFHIIFISFLVASIFLIIVELIKKRLR